MDKNRITTLAPNIPAANTNCAKVAVQCSADPFGVIDACSDKDKFSKPKQRGHFTVDYSK